MANQIADKMGVAASDVYSADKLSADLVKEYDLLILGTSTWGTANCRMIGTTA